jgi:hypothetical protein
MRAFVTWRIVILSSSVTHGRHDLEVAYRLSLVQENGGDNILATPRVLIIVLFQYVVEIILCRRRGHLQKSARAFKRRPLGRDGRVA